MKILISAATLATAGGCLMVVISILYHILRFISRKPQHLLFATLSVPFADFGVLFLACCFALSAFFASHFWGVHYIYSIFSAVGSLWYFLRLSHFSAQAYRDRNRIEIWEDHGG